MTFPSLKFALAVSALFFLIMLAGIAKTEAVGKANAETYQVSAVVPSPVSPKDSQIDLNTKETWAEPSTHAIFVSVTLMDLAKQPLPGRNVALISSRGDVDIIEATSKISSFRVQASEISDAQKTKTDDNGRAMFRVTSCVPGEADLTVIADSTYKLDGSKVVFSPLPFSSNLYLTVGLPLTERELVLISPPYEDNLTALQKESKRLVSNSRKIVIPFWLFSTAIVFFLLLILVVVLGWINIVKLRERISSSNSST